MLLIKKIRRIFLFSAFIILYVSCSYRNVAELREKCFYIQYLDGTVRVEKLYVPSKSFMYMEENNLYYKTDCSYSVLGEYCYHSESILDSIESFSIIKCD